MNEELKETRQHLKRLLGAINALIYYDFDSEAEYQAAEIVFDIFSKSYLRYARKEKKLIDALKSQN